MEPHCSQVSWFGAVDVRSSRSEFGIEPTPLALLYLSYRIRNMDLDISIICTYLPLGLSFERVSINDALGLEMSGC